MEGIKMSKPETLKIDDVEYIRKDSISAQAVNSEGLVYVICRTESAGVFAGYLFEREGREVTLIDARRIWRWAGAASLSQLAMSGTSDPDNCKFPEPVDKVLLLEAIEILDCTERARKSIQSVTIWAI
jgi:hypothetical protein